MIWIFIRLYWKFVFSEYWMYFCFQSSVKKYTCRIFVSHGNSYSAHSSRKKLTFWTCEKMYYSAISQKQMSCISCYLLKVRTIWKIYESNKSNARTLQTLLQVTRDSRTISWSEKNPFQNWCCLIFRSWEGLELINIFFV